MLKIDGAVKIGDIFIRDITGSLKPMTEIGVWDEPATAILNLKELIQLRREITKLILKQINKTK